MKAGESQRCGREYQGIEPLIIPQLGEVKANRSRLAVLAGFHPVDEPGQAAGHGGGRVQGSGFRVQGDFRAGREEGFDGEGGFLDGGLKIVDLGFGRHGVILSGTKY